MLHYKKIEKDPSREWVAFIHGAGGSSAVWFKQIREYQEHFNILLIDLRGHGKSAEVGSPFDQREYSFESITQDVLDTMDAIGIKEAHFVGVSLGTIIVRKMAEMDKARVKSMILVGAITYLNLKSRFWVGLGRIFRNVIPYIWLYRLFAFVIMPARSHRESRNVFVREAQKLCQREFLRWFKLTGQLTALFNELDSKDSEVPTLYVMGEEDHLFLEPIKRLITKVKNSTLYVVEQCGHVVNIEKPQIFNEVSIAFLNEPSRFFEQPKGYIINTTIK